MLRTAGAGPGSGAAGAGARARSSAEAGPCAEPPKSTPPELTGLELAPATFTPARRGPAIVHRGRAGTGLRFRLSRAALVRFEVVRGGGAPEDFAPKPDSDRFAPRASGARAPSIGGRFSARGRRGLNRLRFSGRVRARPLAPGAYVLQAVAVDRAGRKSAAIAVRFRIGGED